MGKVQQKTETKTKQETEALTDSTSPTCTCFFPPVDSGLPSPQIVITFIAQSLNKMKYFIMMSKKEFISICY